MVSNFNTAITVLDRLVEPRDQAAPLGAQFTDEYAGQPLLSTAVKIIHKAVTEGSEPQRAQLSLSRLKIVDVNRILANPAFLKETHDALGLHEDISELHGVQIALPQTKSEKITESVTAIPRVFVSTLIDVGMLPCALVLLTVAAVAKPKFDPTHPKNDKMPILLLHGSGFNETEWVIGRHYLKKENYGSVFSLNYDGLVSNDPDKGIDDYAAGKVREKALEIKKLTGQNRLLMIGHSMGGPIGGFYAENFASQDGIAVEHVISIASPWKGAPILRCKTSHPKRYKQMSVESPFLQDLVSRALQSERSGNRKYYSIGSTTDFMVPAPYSNLTEDPRRQRTFSYLGHYGLIASPAVWSQVCSWLDPLYPAEIAARNPVDIVRS